MELTIKDKQFLLHEAVEIFKHDKSALTSGMINSYYRQLHDLLRADMGETVPAVLIMDYLKKLFEASSAVSKAFSNSLGSAPVFIQAFDELSAANKEVYEFLKEVIVADNGTQVFKLERE